jgi:hypothetical protein
LPKLICFNDPHFSRTPPECRSESYPREILAKLHEVARVADKIGARTIACSGDWLHRKGRVTPTEINDLLAVLAGWRGRGLNVLGILGNHDAPMGPASIETRAAGALYFGRVMQLLDLEPHAEGSIDDGFIYVTGTSYFHGADASDAARIRAYGAPPPEGWDPKLGDEQRSSDAYCYQNAVHVHLAHGALVLGGGFPDDFSTPEQLVPLLHEAGRLPDVIVSGHLHFPEGIRYLPRPDGRGQVAFCRIGSLGRVSRDDLARIPAALAIATKGRAYALREIPIGKPAERAAELPEGDPRDPREHERRIKDFAQKLREEAEGISLRDDEKLLREIAERLGHPERAVMKALETIEKHR